MQDMIITLERSLATLSDAVGDYMADQRPSTYDKLEQAYRESKELLEQMGGQ